MVDELVVLLALVLILPIYRQHLNIKYRLYSIVAHMYFQQEMMNGKVLTANANVGFMTVQFVSRMNECLWHTKHLLRRLLSILWLCFSKGGRQDDRKRTKKRKNAKKNINFNVRKSEGEKLDSDRPPQIIVWMLCSIILLFIIIIRWSEVFFNWSYTFNLYIRSSSSIFITLFIIYNILVRCVVVSGILIFIILK